MTDFTNTQFTPYGEIVENFENFNDIEDWFEKKELINEVKTLDSKTKDEFYKEIIEYRTLLRNSFKEYIQDSKPLNDLLKTTNEILIKSQTHPQIIKIENEFSVDFISLNEQSNYLLTIIAIEVAKLFNSKEFKYLKKCDNHKCSLYFIDTSKNHSRRWCSMEICGNRTKVSKFNKKKKESTN